MKTEHQYLKAVCDEIGYKIGGTNYLYNKEEKSYIDIHTEDVYGEPRMINASEIIFTPEFMDKMKNKKGHGLKFRIGLLQNLGNPAEYLYNILGLNEGENITIDGK